MFEPIHHKTATLHLPKSISLAPLRRGSLLIVLALALASFPLSPATRAQLPSPTPDGGYPNNNTAEGTDALKSLTTGTDNTAIGFEALQSNTTGFQNTATGAFALQSNTSSFNTATGFAALSSNTTGGFNTATGVAALNFNTTGVENTANGVNALNSNTAGCDNTANGYRALNFNTSGCNNTANGVAALESNTTGNNNTANGAIALFSNTTGTQNTATGVQALESNAAGNFNTAEGFRALQNSTGSSNTALGTNAGINLTTGSNNILIGAGVGGFSGDANTIRVGGSRQTATFVAGIYGATVGSGVGVIVGRNGHLGTVQSSERFKEQIKSMDEASEAILALKPVTFRYKKELDPEGIPQFGLVAEQVEKVNGDLVARDENGQVYTVRYEAVNAMLLNEFLKEHRKVHEQETTIAQLKSGAANQEEAIAQLKSTVAQQQKDFQAAVAHQQEQIEALTAGLRR